MIEEYRNLLQILACHRVQGSAKKPHAIVVAFNCTVYGSVFDRIMYRPKNWRGEAGGDTKMDLNVSKQCNRFDGPLKSALLIIR
jgi:hypothetical protein